MRLNKVFFSFLLRLLLFLSNTQKSFEKSKNVIFYIEAIVMTLGKGQMSFILTQSNTFSSIKAPLKIGIAIAALFEFDPFGS